MAYINGKKVLQVVKVENNGGGGEAGSTIETEDITITPTKEEQVVERSAGKYINQVTVEPIPDEYVKPEGTLEIYENGEFDVKNYEKTNVFVEHFISVRTLEVSENGTYNALDENIDGYNIVKVSVPDTSTQPILQEKTATENGEVTPDEGYDGLSKVIVNVPSTGSNGLQWKCDNMKTLYYEFYNFNGESLEEPLNGLDTSKVTTMASMISGASNLSSLDLSSLDMSAVTNANNLISKCPKLTKVVLTGCDFSNIQNTNSMFEQDKKLSVIEGDLIFPNLTQSSSMFSGCSLLEELNFHNSTNKMNNCGYMFSSCTGLKRLLNLDLYSMSASYGSSIFQLCSSLTDLYVKNIRVRLTISASQNFTVDSLVNTIEELWDYSSGTTTYTLTMGTTNLAKLTDVYVKLVDVTDEMLANDPYAGNKKPCVVCESTDEGAMTITEYATSKMWSLA